MDTVTEQQTTLTALNAQYQSLLAQEVTIATSPNVTTDRVNAFRTSLLQAEGNWSQAGLSQLEANDPGWTHVTAIAQAAQTTIDSAVSNLANVAATIDLISNAVATVTKAVEILK